MKNQKLSDTFNSFERTVRAFGFSDNGGVSNSKQCNMCNRVKILSSLKAVYPKAFLTRLLETGVVTFSFGSEGIDPLERNAVTVNGKPVIIGKSDIFSAASMFLTIVPIFSQKSLSIKMSTQFVTHLGI